MYKKKNKLILGGVVVGMLAPGVWAEVPPPAFTELVKHSEYPYKGQLEVYDFYLDVDKESAVKTKVSRVTGYNFSSENNNALRKQLDTIKDNDILSLHNLATNKEKTLISEDNPSFGYWGNNARHHYSKSQAWNSTSDLLLIYNGWNAEYEGQKDPRKADDPEVRQESYPYVILDADSKKPLLAFQPEGGHNFNELRWHPTEADKFMYFKNDSDGAMFGTIKVSADNHNPMGEGQNKVEDNHILFTFDDYTEISLLHESQPSNDSKWIAFVGKRKNKDTWDIVRYNIQKKTIDVINNHGLVKGGGNYPEGYDESTLMKSTTTDDARNNYTSDSIGELPRNISVSSRGRYVIAAYGDDTVAVYDMDDSILDPTGKNRSEGKPFPKLIRSGISHFGVCDGGKPVLDDGKLVFEEVIIGVGKHGTRDKGGYIFKINLSDLEETQLTDIGYAAHVSCRNISGQQDWAYVSYQTEASEDKKYVFTNEVVAVYKKNIINDDSEVQNVQNVQKVQKVQKVRRVAQFHTVREDPSKDSNIKFSYRSEPHASPSPDGTQVIFASNRHSYYIPEKDTFKSFCKDKTNPSECEIKMLKKLTGLPVSAFVADMRHFFTESIVISEDFPTCYGIDSDGNKDETYCISFAPWKMVKEEAAISMYASSGSSCGSGDNKGLKIRNIGNGVVLELDAAAGTILYVAYQAKVEGDGEMLVEWSPTGSLGSWTSLETISFKNKTVNGPDPYECNTYSKEFKATEARKVFVRWKKGAGSGSKNYVSLDTVRAYTVNSD